MEINYEKTMEVNIELKLNIDDEEDDLNHLKGQCDIDDENEIQEITAARNPMNNYRPVCVTCNQTLKLKMG